MPCTYCSPPARASSSTASPATGIRRECPAGRPDDASEVHGGRQWRRRRERNPASQGGETFFAGPGTPALHRRLWLVRQHPMCRRHLGGSPPCLRERRTLGVNRALAVAGKSVGARGRKAVPLSKMTDFGSPLQSNQIPLPKEKGDPCGSPPSSLRSSPSQSFRASDAVPLGAHP
jgi:hypothetical protein